MNSRNLRGTPLVSLGLLSFLTIFLCQTQLQIVKDEPEECSRKTSDSIFVWTSMDTNNDGKVLKASVSATSPLVSVMSTALLLWGVRGVNPYYFLPWFIHALRGMLSIQADNLLQISREFFPGYEENTSDLTTLEEWQSLLLYAVILVFNVSAWCSFYEIFVIFIQNWQYRPYFMIFLKNGEHLKRNREKKNHISPVCDIKSTKQTHSYHIII